MSEDSEITTLAPVPEQAITLDIDLEAQQANKINDHRWLNSIHVSDS